MCCSESGGQPLSALGPAPLNDQLTSTACHPSPKSVPTLTLDITWLECTFHGLTQNSALHRYILRCGEEKSAKFREKHRRDQFVGKIAKVGPSQPNSFGRSQILTAAFGMLTATRRMVGKRQIARVFKGLCLLAMWTGVGYGSRCEEKVPDATKEMHSLPKSYTQVTNKKAAFPFLGKRHFRY